MTQITDIFVFTRDLRIHDNEGIHEALKCANKDNGSVKCVFVFRKDQIGSTNSFRSDNAIAFMIESLEDLIEQLREYSGDISFLFESTKNTSLLKALKGISTIKRIHMARDYTPYSTKREKMFQRDFKKYNIDVILYDTHLLSPYSLTIKPGTGGTMYQTFKPFYTKIRANKITPPTPIGMSRQTITKKKLFSTKKLTGQVSLKSILRKLPKERISSKRIVIGGRENGLRILRKASKTIKPSYKTKRHALDYDTSKLSAYHHFGCISTRETWESFSKVKALQRQLVWRDYAYHMMYCWPDIWESIHVVGSKKSGIPWKRNRKLEKAWKEGNTGVPAVDAAMKQLQTEGYIHNRGRMIVANYLIKNLMIDWRVGEKYFAQWLTDYDRAVNFMNWIQIAAVLPTEQATRTMNPYIQARKNDKDLNYIHTYLPELKHAETKDILSQTRNEPITNKEGIDIYPAPIVSYDESRKEYAKWAKKYVVSYRPTK
jgi:deoxyribodipyrimidine photo-lyase